MTYVKLHKTVTDFSSGIQSVNQLHENIETTYEAMALEHSVREARLLSDAPWVRSLGRRRGTARPDR